MCRGRPTLEISGRTARLLTVDNGVADLEQVVDLGNVRGDTDDAVGVESEGNALRAHGVERVCAAGDETAGRERAERRELSEHIYVHLRAPLGVLERQITPDTARRAEEDHALRRRREDLLARRAAPGAQEAEE